MFSTSQQTHAYRFALLAPVTPLLAAAQARMTARDSANLATPFAVGLGVNPATMRLVSPAMFVDDLTPGETLVVRLQLMNLSEGRFPNANDCQRA